jgi:hypothetical protein
VKWSVGNTPYEVYTPSLASSDSLDMLPHGLDVRNKVISTVGTVAHRRPSLYEVYPMSLSPVLLPIWEQVNQDANNNATVDNTATIVNFDARFREMIQVHTNQNDRYEMAQSLRACRKPRELPVQFFRCKLREFNSYIEWIPGTEPALSDQQMKQTFHDAMPPTWRERFAKGGNSLNGMTFVQVVQFFRQQEVQAARKILENNFNFIVTYPFFFGRYCNTGSECFHSPESGVGRS